MRMLVPVFCLCAMCSFGVSHAARVSITDATRAEVRQLTQDVMNSYKDGSLSKVEAAESFVGLSGKTNLTRDVRFLLLTGAVNLFIEAHAMDKNKALCLKMVFVEGYDRTDVASILAKKRVKFGSPCPFHEYCPFQFDALCVESAWSRRFRNASPVDFGSISFGSTGPAGLTGRTCRAEVMSPWVPTNSHAIAASVVDVKIKLETNTYARLYLTSKTRKLFKMELFNLLSAVETSECADSPHKHWLKRQPGHSPVG